MKAIFVLMATAMATAVASNDPGEAAVRFLEKVRAEQIDLEPGGDTALSPSTSATKRGEIARRFERMARDLGNDPLEVGAVKLDGELAGVLVHKISGFDPNRMQVFPVALVKRDETWAAAPVPASFENAGVGYAANLRKRLKALEHWMLREQVLDLAILRDQSADRMRRKIEESLPAATLRSMDSRQAAERFLSACQSQHLPEMLGLLGGLESDPPGNWPLRVKAAERAAASGTNPAPPWRLLVSADVLRTIVLHEEEETSALVSIACLDPATSRARVRLVHLELTKSRAGLWRIDPPGYLIQEDPEKHEAEDQQLDSDLLDAFPAKLRESCPASPQPTAEEALRAVTSALQQGGLPDLIRLISLAGDSAAATRSCGRAATLWRAFRDPSSVHHAVSLGRREHDGKTAASFQFFSARNPDRTDFKILYFEQSAAGWLWTPSPDRDVEQSFREWTGLQAGKWQDQWQDALLAECLVLEKIPETEAPPVAACRKLVESWLRALREGDVSAALRCCARLNQADSQTAALRNLGYELTDARKNKRPASIIGVHRGKSWSAVGVRTDSLDNPAFPLYAIVETSAGPRILPEIDLSASTTRSRDFLNQTTLKRLAEFSPAAAAQLKQLFSSHQAQAAKTEKP